MYPFEALGKTLAFPVYQHYSRMSKLLWIIVVSCDQAVVAEAEVNCAHSISIFLASQWQWPPE